MAIYFVSDLHLFARRSRALLHMPELHARAAGARTFVLGGDIFDFKWSTLPSLDHTIDAAIGWLADLVRTHPATQFHFILGNHDAHPLFIDRLQAWSAGNPGLQTHDDFLRLNQTLFLHGDVVDHPRESDLPSARRERFEREIAAPSKRLHDLYDAAIATRMHLIAAWAVHRRPRVARRILHYLREIGHGPDTGLRQVYFGHTHVPLNGYWYGGLRFHNGGAPIRGVRFRILPVSLDASANDERSA